MIAGSTTIRLLADITDVQRKMADLQGRVGGLAERIKGAFSGVAGMLAGAFSVGAIAAWVHKSIQAIDRLAELSAITGMTAAQVSGLQLAFQLGGMQADRMGPALARLSTAISTGSKELQAMGVATKNADGSLRSTRDVLGDVADAFAGYEDGAGKAAIAVRLFGESGTQMIPLLNAGAAGLAEFDAMAHRLGLTMDEQTIRHAEQFSDTIDLLGQGVQGVGRQIAAQMLPTLAALGDQFLTAMTSGDRLRQIAQTLGNVLRGLYVVALGVGAVFRTLGTYLGGAAAIIVSIARGDFAAAADISRQLRADLEGGLKNTLAEMDKAWNASGSVAVESITATTRAMRRQAPTIAAITEATRAQTAARDEGLRAEIQAAEIANKQWDEDFKRQEDARLAIEARIRAAREMHEGLQTEARLLQMSGVEREIATAMMELERKGVVRGTEAYEAFADAIRGAIVSRDEQRRASEHAQANAELRRAELEAWQDHWQQIGDGFVDALMDGGRSVADYLRDLFRRLVLRPIVQAIVMPITAAFAGTMGMSGAASAQGLGGVQALSGIRSIYDTIVGGFTRLGDSVAFAANDIGQWLVSNTTGVLNRFGGSLMGNASSLGTIGSYLGGAGVGLGLGNLISGQFAAFGNAQVSNIGGTAIGALLGGPLGAAIGGAIGGLINRAFGRGPVQTTGTGITGTFGTGGADVQAYQDWTQRGGWFRRSRGGRNTSAITPELDRFLDDALTQITDATRAHARILGLNADAINGITQQINISLMGLSAEQQQERIAQALAGFADHLASVYGVTVREGETASQALSRLGTSLATVNQVFDTLNHTLMATSLAGGDAASKLLDAFGGAEAFVQATSAFYDAFYTEAERTATATRQLTETLAGMGMTLPATRDAYRALVEAQDLNTEAGRQAYVTLLRLAPAFVRVTDAAGELAGLLGRTVAVAATEAISLIDRQIEQSREAASAARDVARAYRDAAADLSATMRSLIFDTHADQGAGMAYASALSAARGGDVEAMRALPNLASAYAAQATEMATSRAQATLISAQIAAQLGQVAAVAEVMGLGADYQAMLYDVNTAILDVLRTDLQTGDLTVSRLTEIRDALGVVGSLISSSGSLTVAAVQTMDGRTVGALVDTSGRVAAQVSNSTVQTLAGLTSHGASLGGGFATSISGQTAQFGQFTNQQIAGLASIDGGVSETVTLTDLVAQTTGTNSRLSEAILRQLQTPDAGSRHLSDIIAAGNTLLAGRVEGVIAAINQQSAAQQAELKRQQDLASATRMLEATAAEQSLAVAQVNAAINQIWAAAQAAQVYLNAHSGAALQQQTAIFRVNAQGIYEETFGQITTTNGSNVAHFRNATRGPGGLYEQTSGRAAYLSALAQQLEVDRQRVRDLGGVPAFATGGLHSGGLRIVGEHGPELEATGPSRIYSASQTAGMLGGGAAVAELRALRDEVALLRAEAQATAGHTGRTARALDRAMPDGTAMIVRVEA